MLNEDQGYLIFPVQSPPGASPAYTEAIEDQVQHFLSTVPEIRGVFAVSGFSSGGAPNRGIVFAASPTRAQRNTAVAVVDRIAGLYLASMAR